MFIRIKTELVGVREKHIIRVKQHIPTRRKECRKEGRKEGRKEALRRECKDVDAKGEGARCGRTRWEEALPGPSIFKVTLWKMIPILLSF